MDPAELARQVLVSVPFAAALGIEVGEVSPQRVTATMGWAEDRCTTGGVLHGGALMAFADSNRRLCGASLTHLGLKRRH